MFRGAASRIASLFVLLLSSAAVAQSSQSPIAPDQGHTNPPSYSLQGSWDWVDQLCVSGARPRSDVRPGWDVVRLRFDGDRYEARGRLRGCSYWLDGIFSADSRTIRVRQAIGGGDCRDYFPPRNFSMIYSLAGLELSLLSGPYDSDGVCPAGDVVENIYRRIGPPPAELPRP